MEKQVFFEKCVGNRVTEDMLQESSKLFSEHYGIWDEHAAQEVGEFAKAGRLTLTGLAYLLRITKKVVKYDSAREDSDLISYQMMPHALTRGLP